jgi:hypothetical protein
MQTTTAKVVGTRDGKAGFLGSIGVRFMVDGGESGGGSHWSSIRCQRTRLLRGQNSLLTGQIGVSLEPNPRSTGSPELPPDRPNRRFAVPPRRPNGHGDRVPHVPESNVGPVECTRPVRPPARTSAQNPPRTHTAGKKP